MSSEPQQVPAIIRFGGDFELDRAAYQLRRGGRPLKLERIPLEILLLLAERAGQLVSREEITARVWGEDPELDVDNSINGAIRKIRQVLKDDPERPLFIQTVTGRGYRFVAPPEPPGGRDLPDPPVLAATAPAAERDVTAAAPAPAARPRSRTWLALAAVLALLLIGAVAVWSRAGGRDERGRVMLAVLPFRNLTGDPAQEYLSDGLTEEMIAQLGSRDPTRLGVISRASVMQYRNTGESPRQIGETLGAHYVLLGSLRRQADIVRVTARLVRAKDQTQIWAHQYDRQMSGLLTLQGEIAEEIADAIESSVGIRSRPSNAGPVAVAPGVEAYDLFLRGEYLLGKRNAADIEAAIGYFEQATGREPRFARAWAALADAEVLLATYSVQPADTLVARARAAALRALEIDPSLAAAHAALALIVQNHDWDWLTAGREFRQAIALDPNYATAHHWYAEHLMWQGRFDEALRESERARELDPLSLIIAADNAAILYFAGKYERAIEQFRSVHAVNPTLSRANLIVAAYVEKGMFDEALAEEARWRQQISPAIYWATLGYVYGRAGRSGEARHAIAELARSSEPVQARVYAWAYAGLHDTEQTLAWLEKAFTAHSGEMVTLKVNPAYDFLRGDARFESLVDRVGLGERDAGRPSPGDRER